MSSPKSASKALRFNLRALRDLREMTQAEMASKAGIASAAISHFETGQRVPSIDSLVKLADALHVSVDVLLGRASLDAAAPVDPVFLRASRADARTLEAVRKVTTALLSDLKSGR